jgi:hypothetical protein
MPISARAVVTRSITASKESASSNELDLYAQRAPDLLRHVNLSPSERSVGAARMERWKVKSRNRHPQNFRINDRLQVMNAASA